MNLASIFFCSGLVLASAIPDSSRPVPPAPLPYPVPPAPPAAYPPMYGHPLYWRGAYDLPPYHPALLNPYTNWGNAASYCNSVFPGGVIPPTPGAPASDEALIEAATRGDVDMVNWLMQQPTVNPGSRNNLALRRACRMGYWRTARLLLSSPRVNPADMGSDALLQAVLSRRPEMVQVILADARADPNAQFNGRGLLVIANELNNPPTAEGNAIVKLLPAATRTAPPAL